MFEPPLVKAAEAIVLRRRNTIRWVFPVIGAALMLAAPSFGRQAPGSGTVGPLLIVAANLVMLTPLGVGLMPLFTRRAAVGIALLAIVAYGVELVGVSTGVPYGRFEYVVGLEPLLLGRVPLALPLLWVPMVLNGYLLAASLIGISPMEHRARIVATVVVAAVATTALDVVLDPGAVALGFWRWAQPGAYYGVPPYNYLGWLLTSAVASTIAVAVIPAGTLAARAGRFRPIYDTLTAFLIFWGLVNLLRGQWIAALAAAAIWAVAGATESRSRASGVQGSSAYTIP